jgi:uncharacterized cupredoxin-like copper-binding protein
MVFFQWKHIRLSSSRIIVMSVGLLVAVPASRAVTSGGAAHAQTVAVDTTIAISTTGSNLEFTPSRISAKQGTRVTIRYTNEGTLPHNIVLVKDEHDIDVLGTAAFQAKDTGYVPLQHREKMLAFSELAVPGTTVEITFEVPPAGEYYFVCLYPGHYNMMVGTLRSLN